MNAKQFALANPLVVVGGLLALYVVIRGASNVGKDLGNLVGSLGAGAVNGGASAAGDVAGAAINAPMTALSSAKKAVVANMSSPSTNPLYDFGSWVGGTTYDVLHPSQWGNLIYKGK
jgi:hypothetical protein